MNDQRWTAVDEYFSGLVVSDDPARGAIESADQAGLPPIAVSPVMGKLLYLLAKMTGARRVLEVGTLAGYSSIWMARALPSDGQLITLEIDARHAEIARANIAAAGVGDLVDVRLGPALETLPELAHDGSGPFDLVFIDADKPSNEAYLDWALTMSRPGSVIIVDNVVREGGVVTADDTDAAAEGARRVTERMARERRLDATALQTVGIKGWDGFLIALVTEG
ncbi:MAG TPA: O-methyltransferase [Pseudonocardia sp.]|jgi:predicted O-methyltransferase YrrM|nr:O-methyltransferase [Pseudonocardia sp.]